VGESLKSPLDCILTHWKDIAGRGSTESKKIMIKYCNQWWPLYKLEEEDNRPLNGTLDYHTLLQLMLFLRREGKWDEVSYADMFFTFRNHPEWQRDCGLVPPQDPLVLALGKDYKGEMKRKLKRCCSSCSIGQRCTRVDKTRRAKEQSLEDLFKPPPQPQEQDGDSEEPSIPPDSPISSRTRGKAPDTIQAPLREAVGPQGGTMLVKVPFCTSDLETWEKKAKNYRNDPESVTRHFRFIIKQHNPDWEDMQLLLDHLTETEKQLVLKTAQNMAEDHYRAVGGDYKEFLPLHDNLKWDPNRSAHVERLQGYREWIARGMERAIPKTINWSALYEIKQGPSESPSEFLDRLRDTMRRNTPLDPSSEVGIQHLVSLFLGQATGDIRRKLQKLPPPRGRSLETLLEEAWK
uniref:Core shell protein Gag P30 domain-containing protein n=1 Tax=Bubo bubo TaxID=30461 RepID=A0A8C0IF25_BUBBB